MCGIAGIWSEKGGIDRRVLESMCDVIAHRGPDDSGVYIDDHVGIGSRRLSIIDIEGGHQPIANAAKTHWIVYNGELYNYRELRRQLEDAGYTFQTATDTEVVLGAFDVWGADCVTRFNGIFAFAIWDTEHGRLFLARDHLGVKPLYYYTGPGKFVFGSEIKSILEDKTVPRELDVEALDSFLTYRYVPSPDTLLRGIQKLPPGHRLTLQGGVVVVDRYWNHVPVINYQLDEVEATEQLAERFEQAVRRQLVSDVPVGLMLSGGIDSGAVLAVMSKYTPEPVKTFTVGFKEQTDANELDEARETAEIFGADHHDILVDAIDHRDFLSKVMWHLEEPISTTSILPFYYVSELAGRHVKVVMTGQGADEPFAGYNRYRGEKLGGYLRKFPSVVQQGLSEAMGRIPHRGEQFRRAARALTVEDPLERFIEVYAVFPAAERQELYRSDVAAQIKDHDPSRAIARLQREVAHLDSLAQMLYIDTRVWLPDDLLLYGDKLSMAHSLEARVPFLDRQLIEFVETIPPELKLRGLTGKYIHKRAASRLLPPQIIKRRKKGFATPMDRWLQTDLIAYVRDILLAPGAATREYFRPEAVEQMLQRHASGRISYQRQIFALLVLELWHRIFIGGSRH
jgi:asparagine synthase (glutamine-hydrolysing)